MSRMLNLREAAEAVGLSAYALRIKVKQGCYPYIRVGRGRGRIFFNIDMLRAAIEKEQLANMEQQKQIFEDYQRENNPTTVFLGSILGGKNGN